MEQSNSAPVRNGRSILRFSERRLSLLLLLGIPACSAFGQTLTTLHNFGSAPHDGQAPGSGVIVDKKGHLFGTTGVGGNNDNDGTVFELSPPSTSGGAWTETILHRFRGMPDGKIPLSRLVMTSDGAVFGTTLRGGANDSGTAYTVTTEEHGGAGKEKVIYDFGVVPSDVISPDLGFLVAPGGAHCDEKGKDSDQDSPDGPDDQDKCHHEVLYGADQGGANLTGAVYMLTPPHKGSTWTETILYNFKPFQSGDGLDPSSELVRDARGNLYGVTAQGGVNNLGAVYEVSPPAIKGGAWTETVLYSFNGTDGTIPAGKLLLGAQGQLYGTTNGGGSSNGTGTVFQLSPPRTPGGAWTHSIVYAFTGGTDGSSPENGVIADEKGRLFGTAAQVIFMLTPPATSSGMWAETVLHTFTGPDGFSPGCPLTLFKNALYGTTSQAGGSGAGTAFQLTLP